jgi:hypothetical protein
MVLLLKQWKSRSSPGIAARGAGNSFLSKTHSHVRAQRSHTIHPSVAGWSSPVARQAHNLKVTGSNPVPATNTAKSPPNPSVGGLLLCPACTRSVIANQVSSNRPGRSRNHVLPKPGSTHSHPPNLSATRRSPSASRPSASAHRPTPETPRSPQCRPAGRPGPAASAPPFHPPVPSR